MNGAVHEEKMGRRSFLGYGIAAVGAFIGTVLGASTAVFAASPLLQGRRGTSVTLGPIAGFQVGVPKMVEFSVTRKDGWVLEETAKSVWVVRMGESEFITYSSRCTHLGCMFSWQADQKQFYCPCHGGVFSIQGDVTGGPPPRSLDRLDCRVAGGKLVVDYKEFRLGVPEKVEA